MVLLSVRGMPVAKISPTDHASRTERGSTIHRYIT
ncbi:hypothetical protein SAMN05421869_12838 [Nonomuraea jiangxiensis]|uniref:Uncharacterized protein n=1 Tax=Nonomuraea jiangxiensis TaxID=633440 RepID=A0A1G9LKP3_9ACTN|nr:hypothetical protein SAMN05421869_12838 [Nonomuraea jiangxiensis]